MYSSTQGPGPARKPVGRKPIGQQAQAGSLGTGSSPSPSRNTSISSQSSGGRWSADSYGVSPKTQSIATTPSFASPASLSPSSDPISPTIAAVTSATGFLPSSAQSLVSTPALASPSSTLVSSQPITPRSPSPTTQNYPQVAHISQPTHTSQTIQGPQTTQALLRAQSSRVNSPPQITQATQAPQASQATQAPQTVPATGSYFTVCSTCTSAISNQTTYYECLSCPAYSYLCELCFTNPSAFHEHDRSTFVSNTDAIVVGQTFFVPGWITKQTKNGRVWYQDQQSKIKTFTKPAPNKAPQRVVNTTPTTTTIGPLPRDWSEHKDPNGRTFYYHKPTKQSSWTRPRAPEPPKEPEPLPSGWTEHKTGDGKTYFWHAATNVSNWRRPGSTIPTPSLNSPGSGSASTNNADQMTEWEAAAGKGRRKSSMFNNATTNAMMKNIKEAGVQMKTNENLKKVAVGATKVAASGVVMATTGQTTNQQRRTHRTNTNSNNGLTNAVVTAAIANGDPEIALGASLFSSIAKGASKINAANKRIQAASPINNPNFVPAPKPSANAGTNNNQSALLLALMNANQQNVQHSHTGGSSAPNQAQLLQALLGATQSNAPASAGNASIQAQLNQAQLNQAQLLQAMLSANNPQPVHNLSQPGTGNNLNQLQLLQTLMSVQNNSNHSPATQPAHNILTQNNNQADYLQSLLGAMNTNSQAASNPHATSSNQSQTSSLIQNLLEAEIKQKLNHQHQHHHEQPSNQQSDQSDSFLSQLVQNTVQSTIQNQIQSEISQITNPTSDSTDPSTDASQPQSTTASSSTGGLSSLFGNILSSPSTINQGLKLFNNLISDDSVSISSDDGDGGFDLGNLLGGLINGGDDSQSIMDDSTSFISDGAGSQQQDFSFNTGGDQFDASVLSQQDMLSSPGGTDFEDIIAAGENTSGTSVYEQDSILIDTQGDSPVTTTTNETDSIFVDGAPALDLQNETPPAQSLAFMTADIQTSGGDINSFLDSTPDPQISTSPALQPSILDENEEMDVLGQEYSMQAAYSDSIGDYSTQQGFQGGNADQGSTTDQGSLSFSSISGPVPDFLDLNGGGAGDPTDLNAPDSASIQSDPLSQSANPSLQDIQPQVNGNAFLTELNQSYMTPDLTSTSGVDGTNTPPDMPTLSPPVNSTADTAGVPPSASDNVPNLWSNSSNDTGAVGSGVGPNDAASLLSSQPDTTSATQQFSDNPAALNAYYKMQEKGRMNALSLIDDTEYVSVDVPSSGNAAIDLI